MSSEGNILEKVISDSDKKTTIEEKQQNDSQTDKAKEIDCSMCKQDIPIAFSVTEIISSKPIKKTFRKLRHGSAFMNILIVLLLCYVVYYFYLK